MSAFLFGIRLQWKLDFRNRFVLLTYYVIPLLMFAFMSGIFISINPESKATILQTMTIFSVTMGAILGAPMPLTELYGSEIKKAYKVGGIPLWVTAINNFISAFIHLMLVSLIIFFVSPIAFGAEVPTNIGLYFLSLAILIIVSLSVGTCIGLLVKSASKLTLISQVIFLPSLMLSGIMFPASMLPRSLEYAGKVFPATWGLRVMTNEVFNIRLFLPLIALFIVAVAVSAVRLSKMVKE